MAETDDNLLEGIAIIGMAGRFPGAESVAAFWQNQLQGIESISQFRVEELEVANAPQLAADPDYIRARAILEDIDMFDAGFFGILPKEAELMDPQHRLFLECCWEAFESAGYDPMHYPGEAGVYAGSSLSSYFLSNICSQPGFVEDFTGNYQIGNYAPMVGNSLDFLATRVSYKLNLRGPSVTLQSACSTSLVAVCQACQSLLTYQCDAALAGGASITLPQKRGYLYQEGGMGSADGHCRTFDADAQGTVFGSGAAVVLLKRLEDAVRDGDTIHAVIRGFAVNNDGANKASYTAPSVDGQSKAIALAHEIAGIHPETIGYIEAHGTATPLGDPIELEALNRAFRAQTAAKDYCVIGTAKTNIGHLDIAAGVTGLIHAANIVREGKLPPTLHFKKPNPRFDLANSPFRVNTQLKDWTPQEHPRRAGVSAFGVGGTNAHVVIEQPPAQQPSPTARDHQLLLLSAKTPAALDHATANLADYFAQHPEASLADSAFTLQAGRGRYKHRRALVTATSSDAAQQLRANDPRRVLDLPRSFQNPEIVFLFPGQGVQSVGMCRDLFAAEPVFRRALETCSEMLHPHLGESILDVIYPAGTTGEAQARQNQERLNQTRYAQPAIFAIEYALAQLWLSWGIRPAAMAGHSIGEYVAACIAGTLSLADALMLVTARGRLMQDLPPGSMLAIRAGEAVVAPYLTPELDLAAVNSPALTVLSGTDAAIDSLAAALDAAKIAYRRLATSHAFHSRMMDPMLEPFTAYLRKATFHAPRIPYVSTLTGQWITPEAVADPAYWTRQVRSAVRFADAVRELAHHEPKSSDRIFLELGPGETLSQIVRQTTGTGAEAPLILSTLAASRQGLSDQEAILSTLGKLWIAGVEPDWKNFHKGHGRRRVTLPTYPFERKRFWIDPPKQTSRAQDEIASIPASVPSLPEILQPAVPSTSTFEELSPMTTSLTNTLDHRGVILNDLKALVTDLSGEDLASAPEDASFFDLGFDSLFLTQLTQSIQGKYKVKVTFRQIMEQFSTLGSLAGYLAGVVEPPPVAAPAPVAAAPAAPVAQATAVPAFAAESLPLPAGTPGSYEALFARQMQVVTDLFQSQLAVLRGQPATAPAAAAAKAAPPAISPLSASAPTPTPETAPNKEAKPRFIPFKPLQRGEVGGLTAKQEKYVASLVARYNQRTAGSKAHVQQHRHILADPRVVSGFQAQVKELVYPIVTPRSSGSHLWDIDGNRYVDILNGFGCILFGHSPQFGTQAIEAQLTRGFPIGPQTELAGKVAALLAELTGNERITFCNTGSEAVMAALRLARTVTGRNLIVLFSGDYHGQMDEVLVKSIRNERSMPVAPGIPRESVANVIVLDYGSPEALEVIRRRAHELAAVLVEPVQSRHPDNRPVEFLKEVRTITRNSGTCLIFDEVVTGFRTHPGGTQALFGIRADLATYGKVIAGGMPIGIIAGNPTYMDALDGGFWQYGDSSFPEVGVTFVAGTFVRHPLTMAAVRACALHLKQAGPALQENLNHKNTALITDLNTMFREFQFPSEIQHFSSMSYFGIAPDQRLPRLIYYHLRERGVHVQEGFPCFLTTAHTDEDLDFVRKAFRDSLEEMREGDALPKESAAAASRTPVSIPSSLPAGPVLAELDVPITEQQREILLATQLGDEANCAFNESVTLTLNGPLDESALLQAFSKVVARHDSLRFTIAQSGDTIHIGTNSEVHLGHEDLTALSEPQQHERLKELIHHEGNTPFDLKNGPLFRGTLVRLGDARTLLVFTAHHIAVDGWSMNVLFDELGKLYTASLQNKPADLLPVLSFAQYATDQKARLNSSDRDTTEKFWLDRFATLPSPLQLPLDRPRTALRSNAGATRRRVFGGELYTALRKSGAKQGNSLFVTLLSSYAVLLHRLAQQEDIVIGIPIAGQSAIAGKSLIGHCVNFLPVRTHFAAEQPFSQFVAQVKSGLFDALDNQDYTYGTLLQKLKIPRDPSRNQLVEVQFNVETLGSRLEFQGLSVELEPNGKTAVNMDLFFNFVDRGTELVLDCDYNTSLFDESTIQRWFDHLETIFRAILEDRERPTGRLPLLNPQQKQQILIDWNQTRTSYPRESTIHRVFEEQAALTPHAIALVCGPDSLCFGEANSRANQLANFLRREHAAGGDLRVAVSMDRSLDTVVAILGILKAGGAYVPIDPSFPAARRALLIEDAQPQMLITQQHLAESFAGLAPRLLRIDEDWPLIGIESTKNPPDHAHSQSAAYIIYTSGSTGRPKGVLVPHRAVLRLVQNNQFARFGRDEVILQLAPLSFDASTFEIWGALLNGGKLALMPGTKSSPEEIGAAIRTYGATTIWLTAALFHLMVSEHLELLRPLKQLLAGGDVLSVTHVQRVLEAFPHLRLINGYGPTENTTFTACHDITLSSLRSGSVPIGRPIANTRIYLLDELGQPVPVGVAGELHAGGDGLALGYLNAPELTAAKFITATIDGVGTERLYRTGDLARYRPDGTIEFLGRGDSQVKVRGYRIELSEIEYCAERSPLVLSAAVVVRTDWNSSHASGDKRLAAYIIPAEKIDPAALVQQLRQYFREQLPDYMQPAAIMVMESFPRTLNGKIDVRALPSPQPDPSLQAREVLQPRNALETKLAAIWSSVLNIEQIGVEDSIFELGGDSLMIFRITTQANQAGLPLTAKHIFQYRTIAAVAHHLEETDGSAARPAAGPGPIVAQPRTPRRKSGGLGTIN